MTQSEAREKFGQVVQRDDADDMWRPNDNKLRGVLMKWIKERNRIFGEGDEFDGSEHTADLWEWLRDRLGDGTHGVFQTGEPSPSGKFDRVSKRRMAELMDGLYENNDDFREAVDEKRVDVGDMFEVPPDSLNECARLEWEENKDKIETFFHIKEQRYDEIPDPRKGPDIDTYKYYMRRFAFEAREIDNDRNTPNAEEFVQAWVGWIEDRVVDVSEAIVAPEGHYGHVDNGIPEFDEVVEWARELFANDDDFAQWVVDSWSDPDTSQEEADWDMLHDTDDVGGNKQGQQKLTSW